MKHTRIILFLLVLPLTLILDLLLYAAIKTCPTCGSFTEFIKTEGALSFPIVIGVTQWFKDLISGIGSSRVTSSKHKKKI